MLGVVGAKVSPVSNFAQQVPTTRNNMQQGVQTDATCKIQQFCVGLHGTLEHFVNIDLVFLRHWILLLKITFANKIGKFDLEVTTFQMAVLFAWNERPHEKISFENLRSVKYSLVLPFFMFGI